MSFPDSKKKAPNVFLDVTGDGGTVRPSTTSSSITVKTIKNQPLSADFLGIPVIGPVSLTVSFTDLSVGNPTSWAWDFQNNGSIDSTLQNPSFVYDTPGTYSVKLTVTTSTTSSTIIKSNYITVINPPAILLEDGGLILLESGGKILLE